MQNTKNSYICIVTMVALGKVGSAWVCLTCMISKQTPPNREQEKSPCFGIVASDSPAFVILRVLSPAVPQSYGPKATKAHLAHLSWRSPDPVSCQDRKASRPAGCRLAERPAGHPPFHHAWTIVAVPLFSFFHGGLSRAGLELKLQQLLKTLGLISNTPWFAQKQRQ